MLINKVLIEIPPRFAGLAPVGPVASKSKQRGLAKRWPRATGLAEDLRRYAEVLRSLAWDQLASQYPTVELPDDLGGGEATAVAWLWARTVRSPNPAFSDVPVPLLGSFVLSSRKKKFAWLEPVVTGRDYQFRVHRNRPADLDAAKQGTKVGRGNFRCLMSGSPIPVEYIRSEGQAGRIGMRMVAVVVEHGRGRSYVAVNDRQRRATEVSAPEWFPEELVTTPSHDVDRLPMYGMKRWGDAFTSRQLQMLTAYVDLLPELRKRVHEDATSAGRNDEDASSYADAVVTYLALSVSKLTDYNSSLVVWSPTRDQAKSTFARQALPMVWDFAEVNPFAGNAGDLSVTAAGQARVVENLPASTPGRVFQAEAGNLLADDRRITSTDPPYYDNIGYADLSDYFYVWLRPALRSVYPDLFRTLLVPKADELVAMPHRHETRSDAEEFFQDRMAVALSRLAAMSTNDVPVAIYYAFKQSETSREGTSSTGWETFLSAALDAGFSMDGTWPVRTERGARSISIGSNALASSIVLVCRGRTPSASTTTRGGFVRLLRRELPVALRAMEKGSVAPVDLAQASIGPGMAIFSRHRAILEADDKPMTVRAALQLINQVVDEIRGEEEAELDRDTRFAIKWFETHQWAEASYGEAEVLANAMAVSVEGVARAGICRAVAGKVRLYRREQLPADWDPKTDDRLTVWEATQHLIKRLEEQGEAEAAKLLARLEDTADAARVLAYRLYIACERKGWAEEGRAYNGLVVAWPDLERLGGGGSDGGTDGTQLDLV